MSDEGLLYVIEATNAFEGLARHIVMRHRRGLSKSQMDILVALKFAGPMTMTVISKRLAITKEQVSRAMNPLVESGFVIRSRNKDNRRLVEASLTPKALDYLEEDLGVVLRELDESLSVLSDDERAELIDASRRAACVLARFRGFPRAVEDEVS